MARRKHVRGGGLLDHPTVLLGATAVLLSIGWIWLVGSLQIHELLVGLVVVALSTAFCALVLHSATLPIELRWRDVWQVRHLPAEILKDAGIITSVLLRDLFGRERAGSFYRVAGFQASRRDPVLVGRAALAITCATLSPNMIVIGIDPHQGHLLFHQLRRDAVPSSARALGAGQ